MALSKADLAQTLLALHDAKCYAKAATALGISRNAMHSRFRRIKKMAGGAVVHYRTPALTPLGVQWAIENQNKHAPFGLTARQLQVLELVVNGYSIKQIERKLHLGKNGITGHLCKVYKKVGVRDLAGLCIWYWRGDRKVGIMPKEKYKEVI